MTQNYCDVSAYLDLFTERLAVYSEQGKSWLRRPIGIAASIAG
jgi:hypothetical protein